MTIKSKTKIEKQLENKKSPELREIIINSKKNEKWLEVSSLLAGPTRKRLIVNLDEIDKQTKPGETIVIPGKVLSMGEINKKIKIIALKFSGKAKEKLIKAGCEIALLNSEIEKNKDAKGVRILVK
jgi:large subunit ribosomal protein L18e